VHREAAYHDHGPLEHDHSDDVPHDGHERIRTLLVLNELGGIQIAIGVLNGILEVAD
jgi:hypothetical protein